MKTSTEYLIEAADAVELARQQTHNPDAMTAHTNRGLLLLALSQELAEREAAGLEPVEPQLPAAVLDCHDRLWELGADGKYRTKPLDKAGAVFTPDRLATAYGPLRPAEVSK